MVGVSRRADEDKWYSLFISSLLERNSFVDTGGSIMEPFFLSNIFFIITILTFYFFYGFKFYDVLPLCGAADYKGPSDLVARSGLVCNDPGARVHLLT